MTFKNEVVSDADIDRYNLPFQKGDGRWWTRDAERDYYLWGGLYGNPAFGSDQEARFYLYVEGELHLIVMLLTEASGDGKGTPFVRKWEEILRIVPEPNDAKKMTHLASVIKDALRVYGFDGQDDDWIRDMLVLFGF